MNATNASEVRGRLASDFAIRWPSAARLSTRELALSSQREPRLLLGLLSDYTKEELSFARSRAASTADPIVDAFDADGLRGFKLGKDNDKIPQTLSDGKRVAGMFFGGTRSAVRQTSVLFYRALEEMFRVCFGAISEQVVLSALCLLRPDACALSENTHGCGNPFRQPAYSLHDRGCENRLITRTWN